MSLLKSPTPKSILDKIKLIGTEGQGIFFIDREIGNMAANPTQETTAMDD